MNDMLRKVQCLSTVCVCVCLTSRASVMMHPMTAHTRSVVSISNFCRDDFNWSMGTSQAPMAGVAVLKRLSCLITQTITRIM